MIDVELIRRKESAATSRGQKQAFQSNMRNVAKNSRKKGEASEDGSNINTATIRSTFP